MKLKSASTLAKEKVDKVFGFFEDGSDRRKAAVGASIAAASGIVDFLITLRRPTFGTVTGFGTVTAAGFYGVYLAAAHGINRLRPKPALATNNNKIKEIIRS